MGEREINHKSEDRGNGITNHGHNDHVPREQESYLPEFHNQKQSSVCEGNDAMKTVAFTHVHMCHHLRDNHVSLATNTGIHKNMQELQGF